MTDASDDGFVEPGVTVRQRSKTVWIVDGVIDGRPVEIKGVSRSIAILRWNETKASWKRIKGRRQ